MGHIFQTCPRTDGPRHARHDAIVRMLENALKVKGFKTIMEPRIATKEGTRIPDLCAWSASLYIVCDVAVVADIIDPDQWHKFKVKKYNTPPPPP